MFERLRQSPYVRNISILATGSLIAQLITIGASPILTRLYQPESFAILALFVAIVSTLLPAAAGRYEIAIVVAGSEKESEQLFGLSLWFALAYAVVISVILLLFNQSILVLMNANQLGEWLRFVPLALLMSAIVMVVRYYSNHKKSYKVITKIVILQALVTVGINIALGMLGMEKSGLLIGNIIGIVITAIASLLIFRGVINVTILEWSKEKVFLAKKYKDFPLYNATTSVLDNLAVALPVFMLTKYYPEAIVGYYALLIRVAQAPLSFISISVSQVHLKKTSDLIKNNQSIIKYLLKITAVLLVIVIFPTIILSSLAPEIFSWVFGETWTMAGQLLAILMPALALRFVVSTVSPLLGATGHNKLSAVWKIGSLIATLTMFVILAPKLEVVEIFVAMLLMDLMLYFIYYLLILYAALKPVGYR